MYDTRTCHTVTFVLNHLNLKLTIWQFSKTGKNFNLWPIPTENAIEGENKWFQIYLNVHVYNYYLDQ